MGRPRSGQTSLVRGFLAFGFVFVMLMFNFVCALQMDPALSSFMSNLKQQSVSRKIGSFEATGKGNPIIPIDVILIAAPAAPTSN